MLSCLCFSSPKPARLEGGQSGEVLHVHVLEVGQVQGAADARVEAAKQGDGAAVRANASSRDGLESQQSWSAFHTQPHSATSGGLKFFGRLKSFLKKPKTASVSNTLSTVLQDAPAARRTSAEAPAASSLHLATDVTPARPEPDDSNNALADNKNDAVGSSGSRASSKSSQRSAPAQDFQLLADTSAPADHDNSPALSPAYVRASAAPELRAPPTSSPAHPSLNVTPAGLRSRRSSDSGVQASLPPTPGTLVPLLATGPPSCPLSRPFAQDACTSPGARPQSVCGFSTSARRQLARKLQQQIAAQLPLLKPPLLLPQPREQQSRQQQSRQRQPQQQWLPLEGSTGAAARGVEHTVRVVRVQQGVSSPRTTNRSLLTRQRTPYAVRRLTTGTASGSFGHLDFLDFSNAAGDNPSCIAVSNLLGPRNTTGQLEPGSSAQPALSLAMSLPQLDPLPACGASDRSHRTVRRARFVDTDADSGALFSPHTTAPALLARQLTPFPLQWAAGCWWTDSYDGTGTATETAYNCWAAMAPMEPVTESGVQGGDGSSELRLTDHDQAGAGLPEASEALALATYGSRHWLHTDSMRRSRHGGTVPAAHPHVRALKVQVSLTKSRRPSVSSLVSLGTDPESAAVSIAVRTSNCGFGGANTPTRRGRRRNLAGNENMSWDLVPRLPTPSQVALIPAASDLLTIASGQREGAAGNDGDNGNDPRVSAPGHQDAFLVVAMAQDYPAGVRLPLPQQLQDLTSSLANLHGQQRGASPAGPPVYLHAPQPRPSPLSGTALGRRQDPVRAVWSRTSSSCSLPMLDGARSPLPPPQQSCHRLRSGAESIAGDPQEQALAGSEEAAVAMAVRDAFAAGAISPVSSKCSSVHKFAIRSAHPELGPRTATRATQSSDGRGVLILSAAAGKTLTGYGYTRGLRRSCLSMRPSSVSNVTAYGNSVDGGGQESPVTSVGTQPREGRRMLCHTGSVRSRAPTEDDSAESLAKIASEMECGSEKGVEFGDSLEDVPGAPRFYGACIGEFNQDGEGGLCDLPDGPMQGGGAPSWESRFGSRGGGQEAALVSAVVSGGEPQKSALPAGACSPLRHPVIGELLKASPLVGGGSSRLSRCT